MALMACLPAGPAQAAMGCTAYGHGEQAGTYTGMLFEEQEGWPRRPVRMVLWHAGHDSDGLAAAIGGASIGCALWHEEWMK
jgi:hypothetical protein